MAAAPLAGVEDPGQGPLAIGRIGWEPQLGVVDDRRQRVVQLVKDATRQDSQAADALQGDDLTPQGLELVATALVFQDIRRLLEPLSQDRPSGVRPPEPPRRGHGISLPGSRPCLAWSPQPSWPHVMVPPSYRIDRRPE